MDHPQTQASCVGQLGPRVDVANNYAVFIRSSKHRPASWTFYGN